MSTPFQILVLFAAFWIVLRVLKALFVKSPLHDLDGPPPESFVVGAFSTLFSTDLSHFLTIFDISGNIKQVYGILTLPWHRATVKKYGGAFKIHGLFGVSRLLEYS
jgi:hypothetical protein